MSPGIRAALLIASIAVAAGQGVAADSLHRYTVAVDADLDVLTVTACFDGEAPTRLRAQSSRAHRYVYRAHLLGADENRRLSVTRSGIRLYSVPADSCIEYVVDIGAPARDDSIRGAGYVGRDLATSAGMWFWRPRRLPTGTDIEMAFLHPDGFSVSAPWRMVERGPERTVYRIGSTPAYWPATVAIGRFPVLELEVPGARPRLGVLPGSPPTDTDAMEEWLSEAAFAVATLYGRFPLESPQFLVVPYRRSGEPVPWARVHRGGGPAAHFFIDQRRPLQEFRDDWTATHELSHMLLPYVSRDDAWLSEGVASYYQNVLRARAGMISTPVAWSKLYAGFQRGVRGGARGRTLRAASRNMGRSGGYMRVYWSGAAITLLADVRLRQLTDGELSMDVALDRLQACCLSHERMWTAKELFEHLDELTDSDVFTTLYDEHVHARTFPEVRETLEQLGVRERRGNISLVRDAPLAHIRDAIMEMPPAVAAALQQYEGVEGSAPVLPAVP